MIETKLRAYFKCDCAQCKGMREEISLSMENMHGWPWYHDQARKAGWVISPNGKYCIAPGHEKDTPKNTTHRHH